ncbi:MAG: DUF1611 domain-containing protein [candidate division Zixibacteria bacterium]|nr:DUF1611 domain-containing protein [candidate division Zixibacteria bacterium]
MSSLKEGGKNKRRFVILAEGKFTPLEAKTAYGLIRYCPDEVVAIIDSTRRGKNAQKCINIGGNIPVVKDVADSLRYNPDTLLVGIAPRGGKLPEEWRKEVLSAVENGLNIVNGMHDKLNNDPELATLANFREVKIWDVRNPEGYSKVADCIPDKIKSRVVLTVGTDCRSGKMITTLEMANQAKRFGWNPYFVATGQTGIVISGEGVPIDCIPGDFMAGALEDFLMEKSKYYDLLLVEGQGSILHPGYSGVSLALLHGSLPDAMVLCHFPEKKMFNNYDIPLPPLSEYIRLHEEIVRPLKPSKVVGIALNTSDLKEKEALEAIEQTEAETDLPTTDPLRFGCSKLVEAIGYLKETNVLPQM